MRMAGPRALLLLLGLAALSLVALRSPILQGAGEALVARDPLVASDVIVVAADTGPAGVLEAADLVQERVAVRVALFADPPSPADREFLRRGLPYEDATARSVRQLEWLGVRAVEVIPRAVAGSQDEARLLPDWCARQRVRSVVLVSTADHSRRLRRMVRRTMNGHPTARVRASDALLRVRSRPVVEKPRRRPHGSHRAAEAAARHRAAPRVMKCLPRRAASALLPIALATPVAAQTRPMPALPPEAVEAAPDLGVPERPRDWEYALGLGAGWDSNIDFLVPDGPSGASLLPRGGLARIFSGPHGRLRAIAAGGWTGYPELRPLSRHYGEAGLDGHYRPSPTTYWHANVSRGFG